MEAGAPNAISHGAGTVFNSGMLLHNEPVALWMMLEDVGTIPVLHGTLVVVAQTSMWS
jgi:hypothetical protein